MAKCIYQSLPDMKPARVRNKEAHLIKEDVKVPANVASFAKGKHYLIKIYGCQANVRDGEILAGYLSLAGFNQANKEEEADIVIINTCAVRENAEEKVYGEIGKFKDKAINDPDFVLCVCGCMMQEEGVAKKIRASYPYVNLIFGTHNVNKILDLLSEHLEKKKDLVNVLSYPGDIVENLPSKRLDPYKAFVNISYGCDKFCTYCIVPYTRGRERSRPLNEIVDECSHLLNEGYQEITLLGQNVNSYGKDFKDGTSFSSILEAVAKLGVPRLRFMTSHPFDFTDSMIDSIAKYPNIMKCIHLPVQSGSNEILREMGRRYTREEYLGLVKRIREKIPNVAITTDIIVGFPNESEEEFEETVSLCQEVKYDAAYTFIYSPRKGTPAANIPDNVSDATKHERFNRLLKAVEEGVIYHSSQMVGHVYSVLVDGPSKKEASNLSGYTENNKLVVFKGPEYLKGQIVEVKILEDHAYHLFGELLEDPILILAKDLKDKILDEPSVKEYLQVSKQVEEDPSLIALRKEIKDIQQHLVPLAKINQNEYLLARATLDEKRKEYQEHPLVSNLNSLTEEVSSLLSTIKGRLS